MPICDVGTRVVEFVRQRLQVEGQWCEPGERGFTWWAGPLAQCVWAEPPYEDNGVTLSRVHVRTDLLRGVPDGETIVACAAVMHRAALSGLVRIDEDRGGNLLFASSAYVCDQMEASLGLVVALAAALQTAEAHCLMADLAQATGGEPRESAPPNEETRRHPDEMLSIIENLVAPHGVGPSVYTGPEFTRAAEWLEQQGIFANADETGLTAEYPFGEQTSLLTLKTGEPHPVLGNGLSIQLTLPLMPGEEESLDGVQTALAMNAREVTEHTDSHFTGSWCADPRGLAYRSFFPNLLGGGPGWVTNVVLAMTRRAKWAADVFGRAFDPHAASATRNELWEELADLGDAEFQAFLSNMPLGEDREKAIIVLTAMRDALREQRSTDSATQSSGTAKSAE